MSAWVLPDHIADVLPAEARRTEELRRVLLDTARGFGYELVTPPLLEHLESLLTGTGESLGLKTFKLVDQLSGRSLGLRADTTPQVARIDAHLLNRPGVTRLCYCGPVLHTRIDRPHATREPLQFGAEIYGHADWQADLEAIELAQSCMQAAGFDRLMLDLADVRVADSIWQHLHLSSHRVQALHSALAAKDSARLQELASDLPRDVQRALAALPSLFGGADVLSEARRVLPSSPLLETALSGLERLADHLQGVDVSFDLADLRGYAYYTGVRFSLFADATSRPDGLSELVRGGRYDEVGAVFGRKRPAVGFSLDLKELVAQLPSSDAPTAIRAPWDADASLRRAISDLRAQGHTVVCVWPGQDHHVDEFRCDRELTQQGGRWTVRSI